MKIKNGEIDYYPTFLSSDESAVYVDHFMNKIDWRADKIKIFGKIYDVPRLQAWYGDEDSNYSYSNIDLKPKPWTSELLELKSKVETVSRGTYNSVLLNLYRDGQDSNGWHSDDEKELGIEPEIASVTLGQERVFHMRHKSEDLKQSIMLANGSLLIMRGQTQKYWKHQIPKSKKSMGPRINLTFRRIFT